MKKILILLLLSAFVANAQGPNGPLLGRSPDDSVRIIMWQYGVKPISGQDLVGVNGTDTLVLKTFNMTDVNPSNSIAGPSGANIKGLRILGRNIDGEVLLDNIFPVPVMKVFSDEVEMDNFVLSEPLDFGKADLDYTTTKRIVLRNAGNSTLIMPTGSLFDTTSKVFMSGQDIGNIFMVRDPALSDDIEWQTRLDEPEPVQGDPLQYADSQYDNFNIVLPPGDTMSFYIDGRPTALGAKSDTLTFEVTNPFGEETYKIPVSLMSSWTIDYSFASQAVRPATPEHTGEFADSLFLSNNRGEKTRISSMRFVISFDPKSIFVRGFEFNKAEFPPGWEFSVTAVDSTEKYGYVLAEAYAETNISLKPGATQPSDLSYFLGGDDDNPVSIGYLNAVQLLSSTDSSTIKIDTAQSLHNYSVDYMFDADSAIVGKKVPDMNSQEGVIYSGQIIFADKFKLSANSLDFVINNLFPNPVGDNEEVTISINVPTLADLDVTIGFIDPYTGEYTGNDINVNLLNGDNEIKLDVSSIELPACFVYVRSVKTTDVWLLNIMK